MNELSCFFLKNFFYFFIFIIIFILFFTMLLVRIFQYFSKFIFTRNCNLSSGYIQIWRTGNFISSGKLVKSRGILWKRLEFWKIVKLLNWNNVCAVLTFKLYLSLVRGSICWVGISKVNRRVSQFQWRIAVIFHQMIYTWRKKDHVFGISSKIT